MPELLKAGDVVRVVAPAKSLASMDRKNIDLAVKKIKGAWP